MVSDISTPSFASSTCHLNIGKTLYYIFLKPNVGSKLHVNIEKIGMPYKCIVKIRNCCIVKRPRAIIKPMQANVCIVSPK